MENLVFPSVTFIKLKRGLTINFPNTYLQIVNQETDRSFLNICILSFNGPELYNFGSKTQGNIQF